MMRIVSFSVAASEWLDAFGVGDRVVGRFDGEGRNAEALRTLKPDLVVVARDPALTDTDGGDVLVFDPRTFKQVLDAALQLGRAAGCLPEAMRMIGEGELRLHDLHARLGRRRDGSLVGRPTPSVAVLDRLDPLRIAGSWVPDLVELAGGRPIVAGTRPDEGAWETLRSADPDVVVVAPHRELHLADRPGWTDLSAVRSGRVHFFEGEPSFYRPGPALYAAVGRLAAVLHPDLAGTEPAA